MNKSLSIVVLLLAPLFAQAQWTTHGFTIPAAHPRVLWNSSNIPHAQTWLTGWLAGGSTCANSLSMTRTYYASQMECVAMEHVLNGTDCSAAVTWAANVNQSVQVNDWPPLAVETLTTTTASNTMRNFAESAYLVFDWCYDQWSSGQKSAFISNNLTWAQNSDQQSVGTYQQPQSNFGFSNLRDDVEFGIIAYGETGCGSGSGSACDNLIDYGLTTRWNVWGSSESTMAGGIPQEGSEYGVAAYYPLQPFRTMNADGRDIFDKVPFFNNSIYALIYETTPAPTYHMVPNITAYDLFSFSDDEQFNSNAGLYHLSSFWQDWLNFSSNYWASTGNSGKYARLLYNTVLADSETNGTEPVYLSVDLSPPAMANYSALPLDFYASGMDYAYLRTAWDTSSTAIMLQLGVVPPSTNPVGHAHYDWGNFSIWRGGRWTLRETTGYSYVLTGTPGINGGANMSSTDQIAHNVPVFTNVPLAPQYESGTGTTPAPGNNAGPPSVNRLESKSGYFYADVDMTQSYLWLPAYSSYNTGVVGHVEREFVYVRPLETLVVFDRILTANQVVGGSQTAAGVVTSFLTHYEVNPTIVDSNHYTSTNGGEILRQTVLVPASATYRVINENSCTGCTGNGTFPYGQYRVEVDNSGVAQRYSLDVMQSSASGTGAVTASVVDSNSGNPSSGTFTVTLHPATGSDTTIVFNKGETSSGGTINVAGAGAVNLASSVEQISYTDSGPVWGPGPAQPTGLSGTAILR